MSKTHCSYSQQKGADTVYNRTLLEVFLYIELTSELCVAIETAELFAVRVNWLMTF